MEQNKHTYQGCLLGLAVGDAMGFTIDDKTWEEIQQAYGPNGLLGYDLQEHDYAQTSSYTQLTAFLCNGLLQDRLDAFLPAGPAGMVPQPDVPP